MWPHGAGLRVAHSKTWQPIGAVCPQCRTRWCWCRVRRGKLVHVPSRHRTAADATWGYLVRIHKNGRGRSSHSAGLVTVQHVLEAT
jgi:hypothetical protein